MDEGVGDWNACDRTCGKRMFGPRGVFGRTMYGSQLRPHTVGSAVSALRRQLVELVGVRLELRQEDPCDLVNCVVGNWDATRSPCDATSCLRELTRPILQTALYGETVCPMTVQNKFCDPVNGTVNESGQWGACDASSGSSGKKAGLRTVKQLDLYGGCKFPGLTQEAPC
ncbi:hypothetical protein PHYPSEUDO_005081 [Phytophthora pseudosyringae]|uniref:Uncharacterized protein n=1 Tax=Phytophthora pseudosyringae TaxID=221518 RepID=A0A8T1VPY8_9STRA|nr:hypothetical protein PHYPSEUDO_005081 [Phytophthora pseudosyringae]